MLEDLLRVSSNGRTEDFDPSNVGSIPTTRARLGKDPVSGTKLGLNPRGHESVGVRFVILPPV